MSQRGKPLDKLTMGDWKGIFCTLPGRLLETHDRLPVSMKERLQQYRRAIKTTNANVKLGSVVHVRNRVAHKIEELRELPLPELGRDLIVPVASACELLRELQRRQVVPFVVQPLEERRDPYGRRRIRFLTEDGRTVEMFSPHERDLTLPYVWLPMGANPRETRPTLLELDEVFADLS